jgi:hypothetical protein
MQLCLPSSAFDSVCCSLSPVRLCNPSAARMCGRCVECACVMCFFSPSTLSSIQQAAVRRCNRSYLSSFGCLCCSLSTACNLQFRRRRVYGVVCVDEVSVVTVSTSSTAASTIQHEQILIAVCAFASDVVPLQRVCSVLCGVQFLCFCVPPSSTGWSARASSVFAWYTLCVWMMCVSVISVCSVPSSDRFFRFVLLCVCCNPDWCFRCGAVF